MQSVCPGRIVTHFGFLYDSVVYRTVVDALSHSGTAEPGRLPFGKCLDVNLPGVSVAEATAATAVAAANMSAELLSASKVWAEPSLRSYATP